MGTKIEPIIRKINDNINGLTAFQNEILKNNASKEQDIMLQFPTVYIHNWKDTKDYEVYIGESNNVIQRTKQHYENCQNEDKWQSQLTTHDASMYVIGHEHFNKSLTLDIENRLMLYLLSAERVKKIHNMRGNPQNRYYPDSELDDIFRMMWKKLRAFDNELFPKESAIKDSAVFKASPLHKLTEDQEAIKDIIIDRVIKALESEQKNQIIFIEGEAGTGKTVLNSSTFYELYSRMEDEKQKLDGYLMVNHDEQITVYEQITRKLGLTDKYGEVICKPTSFINKHNPDKPVDVAFVDEAHLLLTQGKQSYQGENQLQDIIDRARVTVVMFDENQILTTEQYWESQLLDKFRNRAKQTDNYFELKNQLRIHASKDIVSWIDQFTKKKEILSIPVNTGGYEIKIFDTPIELELALKQKAEDEKHRLSRLVATYDWDYNNKKAMGKRVLEYWEVIIGKWHKPWNRELEQKMTAREKRNIKSLSWAEQPQTINEVGSTFTIQGFDLNYAGVILGPSVKYRDGKIIFDPSEKNYKKMIQYRTLSDGTKKKFGEELTQHEVRILMTRGVEGLYIYACDDELRKALLKAGGKV